MALKDSPAGYSWLSIFFHWVTAATIITLWLLAEFAEDAPKEEGFRLMGLHISIAVSLYLVLWARIIWRVSVRRPAGPAQHPLLGFLATWVPYVLLAGIAVMLISGPLMVWSTGNPINVFDLVSIPTPMEKSESFHELMEEVHEFGADVLYFGVILHVLGGLKHLIFDRDGSFKKIFVASNK